jgi:type I restriction enzyme M protein
MLDNRTKKRIDDCRDILVGKLPDPKSQIEQITIGLIYKFMDDMDKSATDLGGVAKFFSGAYEKYSWDNIFDSKVTATEMLNLYSGAIESMEKNPNIPQLFRDIFKNAYLPYRDPETLKLFLKTIGEFEYTHSEKLGDAFEYLLSVMGSQGDAGQFRTPRHIIDFLVQAINPNKADTILDPACGTAGFLISAFKRIKETNDNQLTPVERKRLIRNFTGYDISPDMVRLSLVNLYLHGFSDPHVIEYDTLTSEKRWNDNFDVILANPPFMSPKGGIRPHKKFTVNSNRSEVLFVDYIAEHLNPNGKAGIIVPEGVIFQSGKAYKELRKMLVDEYLYAVVSLPAGVFNPYSGVKTSILLMDRTIAKTRDEILFVKIDNDGFNLGSQRTAVMGSQLGEAIEVLEQFKAGTLAEVPLAHAVAKSKIGENGDYSLIGQRYRHVENIDSDYELIQCSELMRNSVKSFDPRTQPDKTYELYSIPAFDKGAPELTSGSDIGSSKKIVIEGDVLLSRIVPHIKRSWVVTENYINMMKIASTEWIVFNSQKIIPQYLKRILISDKFHTQFLLTVTGVGGSLSRANPKAVGEIQIPLPPLSIQDEIVAEINGYQKIIDGARLVVENYKPHFDMNDDWERIELGEICAINEGTEKPAEKFIDWFTYLDISSVKNGTGEIDYSNKINVIDAPSRARRKVEKDDILLSTVRPNLKAFGYVNREPERVIASTGFAVLRVNKEKLISKYLYFLVFQDFVLSQMISLMGKGAYPSINQKDVSSLKIPVPDIETQERIVESLEIEIEALNSSKRLIEIFEQKINNRISRVWGE